MTTDGDLRDFATTLFGDTTETPDADQPAGDSTDEMRDFTRALFNHTDSNEETS